MKLTARFLLAALCAVPFSAQSAPVPNTRGNNLTAYNGASGATNNNNWNSLMNVRSGSDAADMPVADFGNCNAIVLRCAQPKCANGGCVDVGVTSAIVNGCVQSNDACKQYGADLVQYISAQLVAQSTAKANATNNAAAQAAAAQSAQQMAAMQQQMQQMQASMAAQNAETVAQLQSALEEQKQLTANAIAEATAARTTTTTSDVIGDNTTTDNTLTTAQQAAANALTTAQQIAAQSGISADILAREQISGQIMSSIENAQTSMKKLKETMKNVFDYAGCDDRGNNCTGPKRVKTFKQKAMDFFDPYETVLDELLDALETAQSVGVDITDIYMMLNGSCNSWAQYLCTDTQVDDGYARDATGKLVPTKVLSWPKYKAGVNCNTNTNLSYGTSVRGGRPCMDGQVIPPEDDVSCTLQKTLTGADEVQRNWLYAEMSDMDANVRVGCASSALEVSNLFRNRKKQAAIDIETLQRIIEQDAPSVYGTSYFGVGKSPIPDGVKFCAVNDDTFANLQKIASLKSLPDKVCVNDDWLENKLELPSSSGSSTTSGASGTTTLPWTMPSAASVVKTQAQKNCEAIGGTWLISGCNCPQNYTWRNDNCILNGLSSTPSFVSTSIPRTNAQKKANCDLYKGSWDDTFNFCNCLRATNPQTCADETK